METFADLVIAFFGPAAFGIFIFLTAVAFLWALLPFAVFGTKRRLDEHLQIQAQILAELKAIRQALGEPRGRD